MRITAEEKRATRERIVKSAVDLFRSQGFDATTTRDIASAAGIATGTLFNYFETKEALVTALACEALAQAHADWQPDSHSSGFEEDLFALIAAELRQLKPLRKFVSPFLETALSPLVSQRQNAADDSRVEHLELVTAAARRLGIAELSPVALQMYWALYTGVLGFWAADKSPKQEDTLALLDESLHMFALWLRVQSGDSAS
ncbi:MAG TPA: TetR/AcrR family transcriptional regulator [Planctomycetaceae bacterium]|nr:TetR/AcrR family transcriptional regulator [Planctomycetaceae bacterium]